jgi:hypothetical protein
MSQGLRDAIIEALRGAGASMAVTTAVVVAYEAWERAQRPHRPRKYADGSVDQANPEVITQTVVRPRIVTRAPRRRGLNLDAPKLVPRNRVRYRARPKDGLVRGRISGRLLRPLLLPGYGEADVPQGLR